ncbi:glycosyltransferase [Corynebacterium casei]|uniref:glycosyltransferase n=1 Tax=Corynebacterium casei TaxID=160386 RepID=UPI003FD5FBEB
MDSQSIEQKCFRIVVSGYINLNVIDGSAFFISGVASMCAAQKNVEVVVVSANPITKFSVVSEMMKFPNIRIVDPYVDLELSTQFSLLDKDKVSRKAYAELVAAVAIREQADSILLRDTEAGNYLVSNHRSLVGKTAIYGTGISSIDDAPSQDTYDQISNIAKSGAKILVQTPQMLEKINSVGIEIEPENIYILPPHVPDGPESIDPKAHRDMKTPVLVYSGKFFPDWNVDKILAAVKSINLESQRETKLLVAGDQFRGDPQDRYFVDCVKYLLRSTPGLAWIGGVSRAQSRELIQRADIGISWRRPALDNSSEFSTKVLEYGAVGKAVILNRTRAHEDLLGADYPLFANSMTEFKELLRNLGSMGEQIELAAYRCYELSKKHWYSNVLPGLLDFLGNQKSSKSHSFSQLCKPDMQPLLELESSARINAVVDGAWLRFTEDPNSERKYDEVIHQVRMEQLFWQHSIQLLETSQLRKEEELIHPIENSQETMQIEKLRQDNENLRRELRRLKARISFAKGIIRRVEHHPIGGRTVQRLRRFRNRLR